MLVNLTPNVQEIERRKEVGKQIGFEHRPQNDPSLMVYGTGMYRCNYDFNFSHEEFEEFKNGVPFGQAYNLFAPDYNKAQYGVADSVEQIKEYFKDEIDDPNRKFFVSMTPVFQHLENKGKGGGWRWHKWGEYIGKLNPQYEHLDDEEFGPDFKYVICFHIYEVK